MLSAGGASAGANMASAVVPQAPQPKQRILLKTDAHAQHIFKTGEAEKLNQAIVDFLLE